MATSTSTTNPAEFAAGAVFGSALYYAGVFNPNTILSQMQLASFDMMQVMLGASATSALIIHLSARANWTPKKPRSPARLFNLFAYDGNIVGGALIGLGMALSGACPGTVLVQFGLGLPRSGVAMAGCLAGAALYQKAILPNLPRAAPAKPSPTSTTPSPSPPTLHSLLSLSEQTLLTAWVSMCAIALVLLRPLRNRETTDPVLGGLAVGAAQTMTLLLARHTLGVSGAYADLAKGMMGLLPEGLGGRKVGGGGGKAVASRVPGVTPSMAFAAGVVGISALLPKVAGPEVDVGVWRAFLGGVSMVLGARIGGGCTSGHGISGLATFATASAVTTAAMFGTGILGSFVLGALGF